jgi:hypothetical protein
VCSNTIQIYLQQLNHRMQIELKTDLYTLNQIISSGIKSFEIKSYQRGYRWDRSEVVELISDIAANKKGTIYCMQPLVVTRTGEKSFEVIDGQQRLTTFKILMSCIELITGPGLFNAYQLAYETRSCSSFFEKLVSGDLQPSLNFENAGLKAEWDALDLPAEEINRDNYHLYQTYSICTASIKAMAKSQLEDLAYKLQFDVKFIWYPVDLTILNTTAEKLFMNVNKNKIRLTGADLIKALFILNIDNQNLSLETKHHKKQIIASEWDEIESNLRNPDFWFFITNSNDARYDVRIGKLFDIITENSKEDDLESYFKYKTGKTELEWGKIYKCYKTLQEWYEDTSYYHRIGFLVNMNKHTLESIWLRYQKEQDSKLRFKQWLDGEIKGYFKNIKLSEVNYKNNSGRFSQCTGVLLLYNIMLMEKFYPRHKFSFGDFIEEQWSLEHIQPQTPKKRNASGWQIWVRESMNLLYDNTSSDYVHEFNKEESGVEQIDFQKLLDDLAQIDNKIPKDISKQLDLIEEKLESEFTMHNIQNLALLDRQTNSRMSNGSFKEKREIILKISESQSAQNLYLPIGTINVFSKTMVTDKDKIQLDYWSQQDADKYFKDITNLLKPYLNALTQA